MKNRNNLKLLFVSALLLIGSTVFAQTDTFEADIMKMQQLNGSQGTTDAMFGRMVAQFKASKPEVTDAKWAALKKDVFDVEVAELNKQLIPVYKKLFTQEEVKAIVAFYESPAGKKLAEKTPQVTMESMQLSQTWAMSLMGKIQAYLN
ncbi:MAG: DUF2059 domain-containing protein [Bacteroidetes bacterium]|nr:DUF2059 domain-containing protein [Bacteroidota bacterium]